MAPFQHGVFELLANMVRVNGAEDEFLPRSETELLGNFPFLTDDEKFKDGPNGEKRQIFLQRNVYEDKPDVWPSLSVSLLTAATEFNKAHDIATRLGLGTMVRSVLRFSCAPSTDMTELASVYPELRDTLGGLMAVLENICKPASGKGNLSEVSELINQLQTFPETACFVAWPDVFRSFCKEYDEVLRVRWILEEEYENLREQFLRKAFKDKWGVESWVADYLEKGVKPLDFAWMENRAKTDYFEEILKRHKTVLLRAGYGGGSSMGMHQNVAPSSSSSSADDITEYIADKTRESVAYVSAGGWQVEYTNKDKLETDGRIFNGAVIEPYAKLTTIQRSLTGDKNREPKKGLYEREQRDFAGTIPGNLGRSRNEIFLDFNNRVNATLTVTASTLHNLRIFQNVYRDVLPVVHQLQDSLEDMYGNLCADELDEARANQAAFTEAHRQLEEWTRRVVHISGLQERLPSYQRVGRIVLKRGQQFTHQPPPSRSGDTLIYGLSQLDFERSDNLRVRGTLDNGCPRPIHWGTEPHAMGMDWMQIPPAHNNSLAVQTGTARYLGNGNNPGVVHTLEDNGNWKNYWKNYDMPVKFDRAYDKPPKVVCWLQTLDIQKDNGIRILVQAVNVQNDGFRVRFRTWDNTQLWEVGAGWLAIPAEGRNDIWTGKYPFSKKKYSSGTRPWPVTFGEEMSFPRPPQVACFLSRLDMSGGSNARINAWAERVTKDGLLVHGDSWWDTELWDSDVLCIATA